MAVGDFFFANMGNNAGSFTYVQLTPAGTNVCMIISTGISNDSSGGIWVAANAPQTYNVTFTTNVSKTESGTQKVLCSNSYPAFTTANYSSVFAGVQVE